ncbi:MAG: Rqc2 family fibronectin-binding protein [Prochlorothrix sp.]
MQPVDLTTLVASCSNLRQHWIPARIEQVYQWDRHTLSLGLRTLEKRGWLTLSWHPQGSRLHLGDAPPREPDTFTFSKQVLAQIKGLALTQITLLAPWERVVDLQFAPRPGDEVQWHLYLEVMGQYSNALLINGDNRIVSVAHQVSSSQSRIRPIQTGQPYPLPPPPQGAIPRLTESWEAWRDQVNLIPGPIAKVLRQSYRGLSSALAQQLVQGAGLDPKHPSDALNLDQWQALFQIWQQWLTALDTEQFQPGWTEGGYTVLGLAMREAVPDVQGLLQQYYGDRLRQQQIQQLQHQLTQRVRSQLTKATQKAQGFRQRLQESESADRHRQQGDLLMAHLHQWQPGLTLLNVADFETGDPVQITLDPDKNAVQNAQRLYKQHQKLKRAQAAVQPLLQAVENEVQYLEQVEETLQELGEGRTQTDWLALREVQEELVQEGYGGKGDRWAATTSGGGKSRRSGDRSKALTPSQSDFYRYQTPQGLEVLVGRNNRQNDNLTFQVATPYDLWFHTQEIPGSHVLLRLAAGQAPETEDLQFTADVAAYHSRARQADRAPVVYTEPRHVYKPKGAGPGLVIYKQERVLWGAPQSIGVTPQPQA